MNRTTAGQRVRAAARDTIGGGVRATVGRALLVTLALCAASCGLAECGQGWSEVDDPRLFRACRVTRHGSGVCICRRDDALFILANAHVVGRASSVTVRVPNRESGRCDTMTAEVLAVAHADKVDLALLKVGDPPPGEAFVVRLADDLDPGERIDAVAIAVITEPGRPFLFEAALVESGSEWGGAPDDWGATVYYKPMACVYGGIRQANSGTPVFVGDRLIGLNEVHPFHGTIVSDDDPGGTREVVGIGVGAPQLIRRFLAAHHYSHLVGE